MLMTSLSDDRFGIAPETVLRKITGGSEWNADLTFYIPDNFVMPPNNRIFAKT